MANNRMYLCCLRCLYEDRTTMEECTVYIAKYYPSEGWYTTYEQGPELNAFFDQHKHGSLLGEDFQIVYESFGGIGKEKADVLKIISENIRRIQNP